jgi:hypothetical protein
MTATPTGWAGSLLDRPVAGGESHLLPSTAYASLAREALDGIGGFDEGTAAPEALAARRLLRSGFSGIVVSDLRLARRQPTTARAFLRHRFRLGRSMITADGRASRLAVADVGRIGGAILRQAAATTRAVATATDDAPAPRLAVTGLVWAGGAATWMGAAREALPRRRRPEQTLR